MLSTDRSSFHHVLLLFAKCTLVTKMFSQTDIRLWLNPFWKLRPKCGVWYKKCNCVYIRIMLSVHEFHPPWATWRALWWGAVDKHCGCVNDCNVPPKGANIERQSGYVCQCVVFHTGVSRLHFCPLLLLSIGERVNKSIMDRFICMCVRVCERTWVCLDFLLLSHVQLEKICQRPLRLILIGNTAFEMGRNSQQ